MICRFLADKCYFISLGILLGLCTAPLFGVDIFAVYSDVTGFEVAIWEKYAFISVLGILTVYSAIMSSRSIDKSVYKMNQAAVKNIEELENCCDDLTTNAETRVALGPVKQRYKEQMNQMHQVGNMM